MRTCLLLALASSALIAAEDPNPFAAYDASVARRVEGMLAVPPAPVGREAAPPAPDTVPPDMPRPQGALTPAQARVEALRPALEPLLRAEGLPAELLAVVVVESGGNPAALSPRNARGLWQLIPETARRYGLTVEPARDERLHIERSTRAAARYLRDLYRQFGRWELALAAYNAGEETVDRAIRKAGTTVFDAVALLLPAETRRYVPAVLAAMRRAGSGAVPSPRPTILYAPTAD